MLPGVRRHLFRNEWMISRSNAIGLSSISPFLFVKASANDLIDQENKKKKKRKNLQMHGGALLVLIARFSAILVFVGFIRKHHRVPAFPLKGVNFIMKNVRRKKGRKNRS